MPRKNRLHAVAYYRTSSAGNVGADKDSEKRQRDAVHSPRVRYFRCRHDERDHLTLVSEFSPLWVSGAQKYATEGELTERELPLGFHFWATERTSEPHTRLLGSLTVQEMIR
jgi:hypothetical protein